MKNDDVNIAFINHDLKNSLGAAISYLQLVTMELPELSNNVCLTAAIESLDRAHELSNEISLCSENENINLANEKSGFITIPVKEHAFANVKPAYERLRKMYPQLTINDTYHTIEEDKNMTVNPEVLLRFRENIVTNAVNAKATVLNITHEMKKHCITISYSDNGKGMTSEEIEKIILAQHGDGIFYGIGTKSIMKIANDHNVYISYTSSPGKGTTIRATVPYS